MLRIYIILLIFLLIQCKSEPDSSSQPQIEEIVEPEEEVIPVIVSTNRLRVRDNPNREGKVLSILNLHTEVEFTGLETDFTEKITLNGIEYDESWLKVKIPGDSVIIGWVYGGGIQFPTTYSMEKVETATRNLNRSLPQPMREIFDLDISGEGSRYNGFYHFYTDRKKNEILHGPFEIKTNFMIPKSNLQAEIEYSGRYFHGKKDGAFIRKVKLAEYTSVVTLFYDQNNSACNWGIFLGNSKAGNKSYREEYPQDCLFDYFHLKAGYTSVSVP